MSPGHTLVSPGVQHDTVSAPPSWSQCQGETLSPCRCRVPWRSWAWIFSLRGDDPKKKQKTKNKKSEIFGWSKGETCIPKLFFFRLQKIWGAMSCVSIIFACLFWKIFVQDKFYFSGLTGATVALQAWLYSSSLLFRIRKIVKGAINADARLQWSAYFFFENKIFPSKLQLHQKSTHLIWPNQPPTKPTQLNTKPPKNHHIPPPPFIKCALLCVNFQGWTTTALNHLPGLIHRQAGDLASDTERDLACLGVLKPRF